MDKKLVHDIVCVIDTGACKASIIKDLPKYSPKEISECLKEMLKLGLCEWRGGCIVFMHRHPLAKEYWNCKASMES